MVLIVAVVDSLVGVEFYCGYISGCLKQEIV